MEELVVSIKFSTWMLYEGSIHEKRDRSNRCTHFMSVSTMGTVMMGEKGCYWLSHLKGGQEQSTQSIPGQGRMMPINEVPRQRLRDSRLKVLDLGMCKNRIGQAMLCSRKSYKLLSRG